MENNDKEIYLAEDKDLIEEVNALGPNGGGSAAKIHALNVIQIKATLRNRKTARDLDDSTKKYSLALIIFAFAQLVLGAYEFLFQVTTSTHPVIGFIAFLAALVFIVLIFKEAFKQRKL